MKKLVFAIISCAVVTGVLASCGEKEAVDSKIEDVADEVEVTDSLLDEETAEVTENEATEPSDEVSEELETEPEAEPEPEYERPDIYMTAGEFEALLGSHLDKMKPDDGIAVSAANENYMLYLENSDENYSTDVDLSVTFGDGNKITIPASYDSINETGWTLVSENRDKISNEYFTEILYKNSDGESISLWTINLDDSVDGAEIDISSCDFYELKLEKNTYGTYGRLEQNSLEFAFGSGLDESSTLGDFLEKMGTPGRVEFKCTSKLNAFAYISYYNENGDGVSVEFVNTTGDFVISRISFKYNYANIK